MIHRALLKSIIGLWKSVSERYTADRFCYFQPREHICRAETLSWRGDFCLNNRDAHSCPKCKYSKVPHQPNRVYFPFVFTWWNIVWGFNRHIICRFWKHDWEDTSYAGPDSGAMGLECQRCGAGGTTTLY